LHPFDGVQGHHDAAVQRHLIEAFGEHLRQPCALGFQLCVGNACFAPRCVVITLGPVSLELIVQVEGLADARLQPAGRVDIRMVQIQQARPREARRDAVRAAQRLADLSQQDGLPLSSFAGNVEYVRGVIRGLDGPLDRGKYVLSRYPV